MLEQQDAQEEFHHPQQQPAIYSEGPAAGQPVYWGSPHHQQWVQPPTSVERIAESGKSGTKADNGLLDPTAGASSSSSSSQAAALNNSPEVTAAAPPETSATSSPQQQAPPPQPPGSTPAAASSSPKPASSTKSRRRAAMIGPKRPRGRPRKPDGPTNRKLRAKEEEAAAAAAAAAAGLKAPVDLKNGSRRILRHQPTKGLGAIGRGQPAELHPAAAVYWPYQFPQGWGTPHQLDPTTSTVIAAMPLWHHHTQQFLPSWASGFMNHVPQQRPPTTPPGGSLVVNPQQFMAPPTLSPPANPQTQPVDNTSSVTPPSTSNEPNGLINTPPGGHPHVIKEDEVSFDQ